MIKNSTGNILERLNRYNGGIITDARNSKGSPLYSSYHPNYNRYTETSFANTGRSPCQAMDVYDGYLFQFSAGGGDQVGGRLYLYNYPEMTYIREITGVYGHANCAQFAENEFYAEGDQFPLCYVSAHQTPGKVFVNRFTTNGSELIRTLSFNMEQGYYAEGVYDSDNKILYVIGYSQDEYLSDNNGTNEIIISVYDVTNLNNNGDGTYTPRLIRSYTRPFIYCWQDMKFYNGMIWILSGSGTPISDQKIYVIDPVDGELRYTINLSQRTESEGFAFVDDNIMLVCYQGGVYHTVTFDD